MDQTEKILSKIRDIAVKLNHDGAVYTRADLAYELKTCGIANDSVDVSRFICEAFSRFGNEAIKTAFLRPVNHVYCLPEKSGTLFQNPYGRIRIGARGRVCGVDDDCAALYETFLYRKADCLVYQHVQILQAHPSELAQRTRIYHIVFRHHAEEVLV